jgi:hypothetical protein
MAKLHTQTLIITVSKITKSTDQVTELFSDSALEQLEAIISELVSDKEHTLIEIQVDK